MRARSKTLKVVFGTAATLCVLLTVAPAAAQDDGGESIRGKMEYIDADVREPVEGVTVLVTRGGAEIGSETCAANWPI